MSDEETTETELHRRAHLYAATVIKNIGTHKYHGVDPHAQQTMLDALAPDIGRAFVIGYAAGVEAEGVRAARGRTSYPPKVPRVRRRR